MSIRVRPQPGALPVSGAACDPAQGRAASCVPPAVPSLPCLWVSGDQRGGCPHPLRCPIRGCGCTEEGPPSGTDIGAVLSRCWRRTTCRCRDGPQKSGWGDTKPPRGGCGDKDTARAGEQGAAAGRQGGRLWGRQGHTWQQSRDVGLRVRCDVMRGDSSSNEGLLAGGGGRTAPGPVNKLSRAALMGPGAGRHQGRARAGAEGATRRRASHAAQRSAAGTGTRSARGGRAATSRHRDAAHAGIRAAVRAGLPPFLPPFLPLRPTTTRCPVGAAPSVSTALFPAERRLTPGDAAARPSQPLRVERLPAPPQLPLLLPPLVLQEPIQSRPPQLWGRQ